MKGAANAGASVNIFFNAPADTLISFLKGGLKQVENKKNILLRLSYLYQVSGNQEQADYYRSLADDLGRSKN